MKSLIADFIQFSCAMVKPLSEGRFGTRPHMGSVSKTLIP